MILEVCVDSLMSLKTAINAGADRIELCSALNLGGLTPSYGLLKEASKINAIDIAVMIRPRSGDFLYKTDEYNIMKEEIVIVKELGYSTIVIGLLKEDGSIDQNRLKEIIELAQPMKVVFHRAFDYCVDKDEAIKVLIELGVIRLLTSGGEKTAEKGIDTIVKINERYGQKITIMPGSGINAQNIKTLCYKSKCKEIHMSGKLELGSEMKVKKKIEDSDQEYSLEQADFKLINDARLIINEFI